MTQVKIFKITEGEGLKDLNDFLVSLNDRHNTEVVDVKFWGHAVATVADDIYQMSFAAVIFKVFSV